MEKETFKMYAILDIETTGGDYDQEGITEIAIYQYDGYNDTYRWMPLSGDIAGLMALTDLNFQPWFSPWCADLV